MRLTSAALAIGLAACGTLATPPLAPVDLGVAELIDPSLPYAGPLRCTSGVFLDPNAPATEEMTPGRACNACHADENASSGENEAPIYAFAGTVYPSAHEPDDCVGAFTPEVEVEVTDAVGNVLTARSNRTGNFMLEELIVFPATVKVRAHGRELAMEDPLSHGDCNVCHNDRGAERARGRILVP